MLKHVDIISDPICPWCYIGKKRFEKALKKQNNHGAITIHWQPFQLNPWIPENGIKRKEYLIKKFGSIERYSMVYKEILNAGLNEGINFDFEKIHITPNTTQAHRLIRWSRPLGIQNQIIEDLFDAFFHKGENIGDKEILLKIGLKHDAKNSLTQEFFENNEYRDEVISDFNSSKELGVSGVPFFIINKKYSIFGAQSSETFLEAFDRLNDITIRK
ncbi:MAG: hypothetical protein CMM30_06165 [Rhodospirillaceae bacterium]|nr:hypothetical protein [Rhodospirillaceae bacterium]